MLVSRHTRLGIAILAVTFIAFGNTPGFAVSASSISKNKCIGCGCKYERDCDAGGCTISCSCQDGPQNDCMSKSIGGISSGGPTVSKLPSKVTNYSIHEAPPPASNKPSQAPVQNQKAQ
jgi:hypothetical protein